MSDSLMIDFTGTPVLETVDAAVHYGGIKAVDGISIKLMEGNIFGILGPNGSGKTTLLAAITRLVGLTRGNLLLDGKSYISEDPTKISGFGIARTFQTVRLLESRTVRENILLATDVKSPRNQMNAKQAEAQADEVIERMGLLPVRNVRPTELSYGAQRRVEIARAIASKPRLLLLDEPTAGMNKNERQEISDLLAGLRSEGMTQLLIEHDVQMMVDTCDYLYAMNFGALIAEGSPHDVVRNPLVQEAYLGRKKGADHA
jgi:ABC-type branched-subunit amino acid transport system ATPase component